MKTIARMALKPGMVLADDVFSYKNELLFKRNTVIDDLVIAKLQLYSVMCVDIKEPRDLATTHFEKVRLSPEFVNFEQNYNIQLTIYKKYINDILASKSMAGSDVFTNIYTSLRSLCTTGEQLLDFLYNMLPSEDDMTYAHCLNSALIAGVFGTWLCLPQSDFDILIQCAFFYDIGKLLLPNSLIWKPGKLTDPEFEKIKMHTINGFQLLADFPMNENIFKATLQHHERCDGSGYPSRLKEDQINIFAKYISIIDAYEAMTSARTYRKSMSPLQVIANFEKTSFRYSSIILNPILNHIAQSQLGITIRLSDDTEARVMLINPSNLSRPLLKAGDKVIDLSQHPELEIVSML